MRGTGRELRGGQGRGFKHPVRPFSGDSGETSSLLEVAVDSCCQQCLQGQVFPVPAFNLEQRSARQRERDVRLGRS